MLTKRKDGINRDRIGSLEMGRPVKVDDAFHRGLLPFLNNINQRISLSYLLSLAKALTSSFITGFASMLEPIVLITELEYFFKLV